MPRFRPPAKRPNGFKRCLVNPAPVDDHDNVHQTPPEIEENHSLEPEQRDRLYITDDETVYKWASKKVFVFRTFRFLYWLVRWLFDGTSFAPTWHSVLSVDEVVEMGRPIYVSDTLVVNCQSIEAFEKLIPFICGPYTRLMIHGGDIKLDQLRRLMKDTVRKVEITATIELKSAEYNNAVQLIIQHVRKTRDNFNLESTPKLITEVISAVEGDRYLRAIAAEKDPQRCNVVHWKMYWIFHIHFFLAMNYFVMIVGRPISRIVARHYGIQPSHSIPKDPTVGDLLSAENVFHWLLMVFLALRLALTSKPS